MHDGNKLYFDVIKQNKRKEQVSQDDKHIIATTNF